MHALEMFAAGGDRHTVDYQKFVCTLEAWELNPAYEDALRKNLPGARIRITDSFAELRKTSSRFDLIVIDNPMGLYGPAPHYCDHYEVFTPSLFRIARETAVIVLNVAPFFKKISKTEEAGEYLSRRGAFYGTDHPEAIPLETMMTTYRQITAAAGFNVQWHCSARRTLRSNHYYLALGVSSPQPEFPVTILPQMQSI